MVLQQSQWIKRSPSFIKGIYWDERPVSEDPLHGGVRGS